MPSNQQLLVFFAAAALTLAAPGKAQPGYGLNDGNAQSPFPGQMQGVSGQPGQNNGSYGQVPGQYPQTNNFSQKAYPAHFTAPPGWGGAVGGAPGTGNYGGQPSVTGQGVYNGQPARPAQLPSISLADWFAHYDLIRHQAQMNPLERQRADSLMSRGLSILIPGDEKLATKALLSSLSERYQRASQQLKSLPMIPPTQQLHRGYYQYFSTAGQLFADYVRVQDNLFLTDATTGQPLAAGLLQRKQILESLEHAVKDLDQQTRQQYGIAPYPY